MGRAPCCDKDKVKRGPWSPEEDTILKNFVSRYGTCGNWIALPPKAGLKRCGKSCRLRWLNYLRPHIKHGGFTEEEDSIILALYSNIGSRWSVIASQLPGRTDNDVKNYWNTKLKKKLLMAGKTTTLTTTSTTTNFNISTNTSMQFSSPPSPALIPKPSISYYGNSNSPIINYQQIQFPLPSLTEVQEHEKSAYSTTNFSVSSSQEVSTILPSFSLENNPYSPWTGNGRGEDDGFLMELGTGCSTGFDFHQETNEVGGHVANSTYSSFLPNISISKY